MNQQCPRCSVEYASGNRFCQACGYNLQVHSTPAQAAYYPGTHPGAVAASGYPKAPLGVRFWASLIDGLIGLGLCLPSLICLLFAVENSHDYYSYSGAKVFFLCMTAFVLYLLPLTYSLIKDGLGQGQSWGKKNMYLMVVDVNDKTPCSIGQSVARNLISTLICVIPFIGWLVEPIMVLATDDGRKLGDLTANTQVILIDDYQGYSEYQ